MGIKNRPSEFIQKELIRVVESGKVTKYRVAKETGIRAQTIGQYCARETEINSARNLDQLCEFLGLEIRKTRRSF